MKNLAGKVAIVTGGSRGIGAVISNFLALESATVVINYHRSVDSAKCLAKQIEESNGRCLAIGADVANKKEVAKMVSAVLAEYGRVDILVNNAGINIDSLLFNARDKDWQAIFDTNVYGVFNCTRAVLEPMMMQRWGRIINISSILAKSPRAGQSIYAASKGAINAFTKAAAVEVASKGITVNAVAPGLILTDMTRRLGGQLKQITKLIPMRRAGTLEEVAAAVAFLASDNAGYITGEIIRLDGGLP
ncbi:MAG: 3-oxoacyl-ACP reductase FabG [bacterium]|nr:3-oxoacyl-ACP reductase FabG [bacterium]